MAVKAGVAMADLMFQAITYQRRSARELQFFLDVTLVRAHRLDRQVQCRSDIGQALAGDDSLQDIKFAI